MRGRRGLIIATLAVASCIVQDTRYAGQPPQAATPAAASAPAAARPDDGERQAKAVRGIAKTYDAIADALTGAEKLAQQEHFDEAARAYRKAEGKAGRMLRWFKEQRSTVGRGAGVVYATTHDGDLDETALVRHLDAAVQRAKKDGEAAHDRAIEELAHELGAKKPGQRAVLHQFGRPVVHTSKRHNTCWEFQTALTVVTYCWKKSGDLASREAKAKAKAKPITVASAPKPPPRVVRPPPPPAAEPPPVEDAPAPEPAPAEAEAQPAVEASAAAPAPTEQAILLPPQFFKKSADCRAIIDNLNYECESADCRAIIDHLNYECETADCRAVIDHLNYECEGKDCRAIIDNLNYECEGTDCRAIIDHQNYECESANCRAIIDHQNYECS